MATAPLLVAQEQQGQLGILLMLNVSEGGNAPGVVALVLRFGDFIKQLLPHDQSMLNMQVIDIAARQNIYGHLEAHAVAFEQTLVYGTREYRLQIQPSALYLAHHRGWQSWSGLAVGLFGTGLLGALLLLASGYTARVEAQVAERTNALALESDKNRLFLRNSSDAVTISDTDGTIIEVSDSFWRMLGYSREDVIGSNIARWDPSVPADEVKVRIAAFFERGEFLVVDSTHLHRDGHFIDVEIACAPLELNGKPVLFASARDITERKQAESELRDQKEFLTVILENSSVGVTLVKDRMQIWANREMGTLFGYAQDEMKNMSTRALYLSQESYEQLGREAYPAMSQGLRYATELEMQRRDGSHVWMSVSGQTIQFGNLPAADTIWVFKDISRSKASEAELAATKERLALALHGADLALMDWDLTTGRLFFGEGWVPLLGYPIDELPLRRSELAMIVHPEDAALSRVALNRHLSGKQAFYEGELRMRHKEGHWIWVSIRGMAVERNAAGEATRLAGTAMNVTARKQAQAEIVRLSQWNELLLNSAGEGIYGIDQNECCIFINPAGLTMLGMDKADIIGKKPLELFHDHFSKAAHLRPEQCPTLMTLKDGIRREGEELFIHKNGETFIVHLTVTPMLDDGRLIGAEIVFQNITDRKAMEKELLVLATTDSLTGCANRHRLLEQLHMELARVKRFGKPAAFLMIDIDHFKKINDTYGHAVGDAALQHFSELARHRLRTIDLFGRLGGEEFGILLPETDLEGARHFAERLRCYLADTPAQCSKGAIPFTVSIGISAFEPDDLSPDGVLDRADTALYRAKRLGRNRVELG